LVSGPIILTCFTNHALDQFLEKVMTKTKKIVRLGGGTKVEALKEYSLVNASKKLKINLGKRYYNQIKKQEALIQQFDTVNLHSMKLVNVPVMSKQIIRRNEF